MAYRSSDINISHSLTQSDVHVLKKGLKKSGFITYYFRKRRKIKEWNKKKDLIEFSPLGLKIALKNDFKKQLDLLFIHTLCKLSPYIKEIIKNGWRKKFISIWEYNVIVNFKYFYDKYYQLVKEDRILKKDFLKLERAWLKITYREYYSGTIISVFIKYLKIHNRWYSDAPEKFNSMIENLELFFNRSTEPCVLTDMILAYNMTEYRSFFTWEDIFTPLDYDIVQNRWFNCSREVKNKILVYHREINSTIRALNSENIRLMRLKENCHIENSDSPEILTDFYKKQGHNWSLDQSSYFLLFLYIMKGVLLKLNSLIFESWELIKEDETIIQQPLIVDKELPRIYRKLKKEYDNAYALLNSDTSLRVSVQELREPLNPREIIKNEQQRRMFLMVEDMLSDIYDISQILLVYGDIALESGYTASRYFKYMINVPGEWIGKPVFALFNYNIELLWTICAFFRFQTFRDLDSRLLEIENSLKELEFEKNRIDSFNLMGKN